MAEVDSLIIESVGQTDSLAYRSFYERAHKKQNQTKEPFVSHKVPF